MVDLIHSRKQYLQKADSFLDLYDPSICTRKYMKVMSVKDALVVSKKENELALSGMNKSYGRDFVLGYISLWILDLNNFLMPKVRMNDSQRLETAGYIYEKYYYLKVPEIAYVFISAKQGKYGEMYGAINGAKVLGWFNSYDDERVLAIEEENSGLSKDRKNETNILHPKVTDKLKELLDEIERKRSVDDKEKFRQMDERMIAKRDMMRQYETYKKYTRYKKRRTKCLRRLKTKR